ncbi:hypothetical protein HHK36_023935 [Tetracentron sinense]|uniref:Phytocyanin domain-containing protein n=1 Tax=Tetracentron sinense TaxID=13715 RepID=A0A834YM68_TETSI|nr:hypothetical protein HHK36_023935 [Tetracentron sinense]
MSRAMRGSCMVIALVAISMSFGGRWVGAQVHHVVASDRGWDPSSDVGSWSSGRVFRVGDKIWFTYSATQESIAELQSIEEFKSCNISNPIRMYTDGLGVALDGEGTRYFASSRPESCRNGLKLHVEVLPTQPKPETQTTVSSDLLALAVGPTPSASVHLKGVSTLLWFVLALLCFMST